MSHTCTLCIHKDVCSILTGIVHDVQSKIAIAVTSTDKHVMFMSSLKDALAENCRFYKEREL